MLHVKTECIFQTTERIEERVVSLHAKFLRESEKTKFKKFRQLNKFFLISSFLFLTLLFPNHINKLLFVWAFFGHLNHKLEFYMQS